MTYFTDERAARIKFRRGGDYEVKAKYALADGEPIVVSISFEMEEGGHSLYVGETCWYVDNWRPGIPTYVSEQDLEWVMHS